jgi:diphthamide biosynthesis protein 3
MSTTTTTTTASAHTILTTEASQPTASASPPQPSSASNAAQSSSSSNATTSKPQAAKTAQDKQQDEELDVYDEIELEDFTFDSTLQVYHYPCPCGDRFEIHIDALREGQEIAVCPGCSLMVRVVYDEGDIPQG